MAEDWASGVLPHGPLTELAPNLWLVTGSNKSLPLPRNMVVARLPDGRLWLHSVVALGEPDMARLEALGEIAVLVVPNGGHRIDIRRYHDRYPRAKVVTPASQRAKVEEVCPVDATCEDLLPTLPGVRAQAVPGLPAELAYEIDTPGGTAVVVNDVLGHGVPGSGFAGWVMSLLGTPGARLGTPRIVRLAQVKDRRAVGAWVEGLSTRPDLCLLTVSHGPAVTERVGEQLREAAKNT